MARYSAAALVAIMVGCVQAFAPAQSKSHTSSTALDAFSPPTLIIGPMIRKLREKDAKKKMPMAAPDEAVEEAPGLRVGRGAWKWPPVWPYEADFFKRKEEIKPANAMGDMQGLLTGMPTMPSTDELDQTDGKKFDANKFWEEEKATETTDLDPDAAEKLTNHYNFYLRDGMSILELGAAENSYLPEGLKPSRHVGVSITPELMKLNPSLTETVTADLNHVEEGNLVKSPELRALGTEPFDVVIMANTVDFLTNPREVFRTAWNLLKPGGRMIVPFTSKDAYASKFEKAQTKMWRDMNDDQHMWICGSFFQFSAGDGWEGLKGFDISPEGAGEIDGGGFLSGILNKDKPMNMYVVQATKAAEDDSIDEDDPEKFFRQKMWMLTTMESRDKELVAPRLARAYKSISSEEAREKIASHMDALPPVYECLIKMDQFAFTFSMQAQLATDLVSDPDFDGNEEQIIALKQGLGLRKPSAEFWAPVGEATAGMDPEDKVNLLAHIVPRFGSGDPAQEAALEAFVTGLKPTIAVIRAKCPDLVESDVQLLGSELLAAEILKPGRSTRSEFASWLDALEEAELMKILAKRKSFKEIARQELEDFRKERAEKEAALENSRQTMKEQVEKARKERTMAFNPKTGKMEPVKK